MSTTATSSEMRLAEVACENLAPREHRRILHHDVRRRKIDGDVDALPRRRVGTAAVPRRLWIDDAGDLAAVLRGDRLDHPSHFAVSDEEDAHRR